MITYKNNKTLFILFLLLSMGSSVLAQTKIFEAKTYYEGPYATYKRMMTDNLIIINQSMPSTPCTNEQIVYVAGILQICVNEVWIPVGGAWQLSGTNLYTANPALSVGIGTATPQAKLAVSKTTAGANAYSSVDITSDLNLDGLPNDRRWSLQSYNTYNVDTPPIALPSVFSIENLGNPLVNPYTRGLGSFFITQDGHVNIVKAVRFMPDIIPPMLNIQNQGQNAKSGTNIAFDKLAATFTINTPGIASSADQGTGIGLRVDNIAGAIVGERTNIASPGPAGRLHMGVMNSSGNIPSGISVVSTKTVGFGYAIAPVPAHLIVQKPLVIDPLGLTGTVAMFRNIDTPTSPFPSNLIGRIKFMVAPSGSMDSVRLTGTYDGDISIDKYTFLTNSSKTRAAFSTEPRGEVKLYNNVGVLAGYGATSPESVKIISGSATNTAVITSGSGFTVAHNNALPSAPYTVNFTTPFFDDPLVPGTEVPVIILNVERDTAVYIISSITNTAFTFRAKIDTGGPMAFTNTAFSFTAIGKR